MGPKGKDMRSGLEVMTQGWVVLVFWHPNHKTGAHHSLRVRASFLGSHKKRFTHPGL